VYYSGSQTRSEAERLGLLGSVIHEIHDGRLDFPDGWFDLVTNNQVMEHVEDLDSVLREIHRVLKPGGSVLSIFPSRDVFREGHIGIPFSHWFPRDSRLRFLYTLALRSLGYGTWKLHWIDNYTRYRSRKEIFTAFDRYFRSELREPDYIRYRLLDRPHRAWLARLLDFPAAPELASALFRKLAFLVIVSRKDAQ
jgi:SAM-dependent methyltransferase